LNRAFVENADRVAGTLETDRLSRLLEALSLAKPCNGAEAGDLLQLSQHELLRGRKIGESDKGGSEQLVTWLKSVRYSKRSGDISASFFFPENNLGPDLIFALRPKALSKDIVLCLLQVSRLENS
jgi:hypothetical protein